MKLIFWTFYSWAKNLNLDSTPEWTALVTLSFLIYSNLLSVVMILSSSPKIDEFFKSFDFSIVRESF